MSNLKPKKPTEKPPLNKIDDAKKEGKGGKFPGTIEKSAKKSPQGNVGAKLTKKN